VGVPIKSSFPIPTCGLSRVETGMRGVGERRTKLTDGMLPPGLDEGRDYERG